METITTKYREATKRCAPRVIAKTSDGKELSHRYDYSKSSRENHVIAVRKLAKRFGWAGTLQSGEIKGGRVWVFLDYNEKIRL